MKYLIKIILVCLLSIVSVARVVLAEYYFNPHFILDDQEMADYDSMTITDIQRFLEEKGSGLSNLYLPDYKEETQKPSTIIWQAAQESQINPKVLITTLQKEQSLIETASPSQKQLDRAMGYRCPDSGSCNASTLHFGKQVDGAAWQFRQYMDNPLDWYFQAGQIYQIDNYLISPTTQATASLYIYTPHYSGNQHFWEIWQKYWGKNYPNGSLVKMANNAGVWYVQDGFRRVITSYSTLLSRFDPKKILVISETDLEKYEIGPSIKFPNYSLLKSPAGKIYLVVDDEIRYITSPEVFRVIGFNPEEVEDISQEDLAIYKSGADITTESVYPTGGLVQNNQTGGVYYVKDGEKHPIYSAEIMKTRYKNRILTAVSPEELNQYQLADPVKFQAGELVKSDQENKVYVIEDGNRRWIKTQESFVKFGYKWDNIITTNQKAIELHPLGEDME